MTIIAKFENIEYPLDISISGNGSVSKMPNLATYHYGDVVQLTPIPEIGWYFVGWDGDLFGSNNLAIVTIPVGTTYYVDATLGNDSNSGRLSTAAWKTIAKVNAAMFNPGDCILFKRGETWDETLTVPSSGTSGAHITYGSYSGGRKPLITTVDLNGQTYVDVSFTDMWGIPSFPTFPGFPSWR